MLDRLPARALVTFAALAAAFVLGGCNADHFARDARANKPIPPKLLAEIEEKNMDKGSPILVRIFKQESELEVWKQDRTGRFALLKTYPICRWSGELGPKVREGDRQAPEGFYTITPAQMNPNSSYYLAFNMGYPNAYDKALGRTGSQLMVHGDCSSRGCYAMTDEQISEIYALGRESFFAGQQAFQVQAYPFRMNPVNMAKHRNNPNMPFWKMIKRGYDHFEVTRLEPKVDVCEKHYVFDAAAPEGSAQPPRFSAAGRCPAYQVPQDIAQAVAEKTREDEQKVAQLVSNGTQALPVRYGLDGGMHAVFASKLGVKNAGTGSSTDYSLAAYTPAPGTIPDHVNPPRAKGDAEFNFAAATADTPTPEARAATTSASTSTSTTVTASAKSSGNFFDRIGSVIGLDSKSSASKPAPARPAETRTASIPPKPEPVAAPPLPRPAPAHQATRPAPPAATEKPAPAPVRQVEAPPIRGTTGAPAASIKAADEGDDARTIAGATPIRPTNSFESRWSAFR